MSFTAPPPPNQISSTLDMSIINEAYDILRLRLKPMATLSALFFGILVLFMGISMVVWLGSMVAVMSGSDPNANPFAMIFALYFNPIFWLMIVIGNFIPIFLQAAIAGMTLKHLRGEEPTFADGMSVIKENLGSLALYALMLIVVNMCTSIFGLFIQAAVFLAVPAIIDQKLKPIEAMRYSFEALKSQYWMAFGIYIVSALVAGLGAIACYVGYIFTAPFIGLTPALAYWKLRGNVSFYEGSPYPRGGESYGSPIPATDTTVGETPRPESMFSDPAPTVASAPVAEPATPPFPDTPSAFPPSDHASGESAPSWSSDPTPPPSDFPTTSEDPPRSSE